MTPEKVLEFIKANHIEFVDLRFMDFPGLWQHTTVPVSELNAGSFEHGFGFDGSSIRGWQAINESDMLLVPGGRHGQDRPVPPAHDAVDHLRRARPDHQEGILARPALDRPQGRRVPEEDQDRRHGLLRAGAGVLHLRLRLLRPGHQLRQVLRRQSREGIWGRGDESRTNLGYKVAAEGRLFPRCRRWTRCRTSAARWWRCSSSGHPRRGASPRGRHRRAVRNRHARPGPGDAWPTTS